MRSAAPHEEISPDPTIPEEANARARTRDGAAAVPRESSPAAAVEEGRKLLDTFRREKRASSLDRTHASRGRGGHRRPRVSSGSYPHGFARGVFQPGGRDHTYASYAEQAPFFSSERAGVGARREGLIGEGGGFDGSPSARSSLVGGSPVYRSPASSTRGNSLPAMGSPARQQREDGGGYQAQLAEALGRWDAERATTADLQGRAAAAAGLHERVRSSAGALACTQTDLDSAREELEVERRARSSAEQEVVRLREQVIEQKRHADTSLEERQSLRLKLEELEGLLVKSEHISAASDILRDTLRGTEERLHQSEERLRHSEDQRKKEAEQARKLLEAARKSLEETEADAAERSRERSARAAGLQELLQEQGALLADREERLAEERSGRAADRLELRELRSKEAGYVRELKERSDEVEELNQVLAQLQDGDAQTTEAAGVAQALRSENEKLQKRLSQALREASALEKAAQATELRASKASSEVATKLQSTKDELRGVEAERLHLEQRLDAVEARVSEAARNRADLSRRLAETAVEAEEAGVENQRLEHRVRSLSGSWVHGADDASKGDLEFSSTSSEGGSLTDGQVELRAGEGFCRQRPPLILEPTSGAQALIADLKQQVKSLQEQLADAEARAAAAVALEHGFDFCDANFNGAVRDVTATTPDETSMAGVTTAERAASFSTNHQHPRTLSTDCADLRETIATLRSNLKASASDAAAAANESSAERQRLSAVLADTKGELALEVDQKAALIQELASLRTRLHTPQGVEQAIESTPIQGNLAPSVTKQHSLEFASTETRADTAGQGRAEIGMLNITIRDLQSMLNGAEGKLQECCREANAAHARAEAKERATATETAKAQTALQLKLEDAEARAAALAQEVRRALNAKQERAQDLMRRESAVQKTLSAKVEELVEALAKARDEQQNAQEARGAAEKAKTTAEGAAAACTVQLMDARRRTDEVTRRAEEAEGRARAARKEAGDAAAKLSAARVKGEATEADLAAVRAWAEAGSQRAGASLAALQGRVTELTERARTAEATADTLRADLEARGAALTAVAERASEEESALQANRDEHEQVQRRLETLLEEAKTTAVVSATTAANELKQWEASKAAELEKQREQYDADIATLRGLVNVATARATAAELDLADVEELVRTATEAERVTAAEATSRASFLNAELAEMKTDLVRAKAALSAERASAVAQHDANNAAMKQKDEAAERTEAMTRAAGQAEVDRLETFLAEADAKHIRDTAAANATEDGLRALLDAAERDLEIRTAALVAAEEAQAVAEIAYKADRELAKSDVAILASETEKEKRELQARWKAEMKAAAESHDVKSKEALEGTAVQFAEAMTASALELSNLQDTLTDTQTRERKLLRDLANTRETLRAMEAESASLSSEQARSELALDELKDELAHVTATLAAHRSKAAADAATQAEAIERIETAAADARAEAKQLRKTLAEANTGAADVAAAAKAAEERFQALAEQTECDSKAKIARLIGEREAEAEARVQEAREAADLSDRLDAARKQATVDAEGYTVTRAQLEAKAAHELSEMRGALKETEIRESAIRVAAATAATQATVETARLESLLAAAKLDLDEAKRELLHARDSFEAHRASAQTRAETRLSEHERILAQEMAKHRETEGARAEAVSQLRRVEATLVKFETAAGRSRSEVDAARSEFASRLSFADERLADSKSYAKRVASELAAALAEANDLRSRLSTNELDRQENVERSSAAHATALAAAHEATLSAAAETNEAADEALTRAIQEAELRGQRQGEQHAENLAIQRAEQGERDVETLRQATSSLEAQRDTAQIGLEEATALAGRLQTELAAAGRRILELTTKDNVSSKRADMLRNVAGDDLELNSMHLTVTREAELEAHGESMGRVETVADAAREDADGARTERRDELGMTPEAAHALSAHGAKAEKDGCAPPCRIIRGSYEDLRDAIDADDAEAVKQTTDERKARLALEEDEPQAAQRDGEAGVRSTIESVAETTVGELAQSLNEVLLDSNEAEARSTEVRQWEEAEAAWAGDQEAARRREEGLGLKKQEAEAARVRAETRLEEALRELRKRDAERGEVNARLRDAERELTAARRLLREAGAERDLFRRRLEDARQETETLLQGHPQDRDDSIADDQQQHHDREHQLQQRQSHSTQQSQYSAGRAWGREAFLREREMREEVESRLAQMRAAMDEQLELDAEALERMDELTLQARKEHEETVRDKERLQGCVEECEQDKQAAESALSTTQGELEEACRDLEDVADRLNRSRREHSAALEQLAEAREALSAAKEELAETKRALSSAHNALSEIAKESALTKNALAAARQELTEAKDELGVVRTGLALANHELAALSATAVADAAAAAASATAGAVGGGDHVNVRANILSKSHPPTPKIGFSVEHEPATTTVRINALQQELVRSQQAVQAAEEAGERLVQTTEERLASAHEKLLNSERECALTNQELRILREEKAETERAFAMMKEEIFAQENREPTLKNALRDAETLSEEQAARAAILEQKCIKLARELELRDMAVAAAEAEAHRFESEVSNAESIVRVSQERTEEALSQAKAASVEMECAKVKTQKAEQALRESEAALSTSQASVAALFQEKEFLESRLASLREQMEQGSQREFSEEAGRQHVHHLLQETRTELEASRAATMAAAAAESEAAERAKQERRLRESAEERAAESEEKVADSEAESADAREEASRMEVRLEEACERERMLRALLEQTEERAAITCKEGEALRGERAKARGELIEARRRAGEVEASVSELTMQVSTLVREASEAEEKDGRVKDDLCAARCKLVSLEDGAAVAAREAEQRIQSLGSEMQARDARISELESQALALTAAHDRLCRSRDALIDDSFQTQDILSAAAVRMRRSRSSTRRRFSSGTAGVSGFVKTGSGAEFIADTSATARAVSAAAASATSAAHMMREETSIFRWGSSSLPPLSTSLPSRGRGVGDSGDLSPRASSVVADSRRSGTRYDGANTDRNLKSNDGPGNAASSLDGLRSRNPFGGSARLGNLNVGARQDSDSRGGRPLEAWPPGIGDERPRRLSHGDARMPPFLSASVPIWPRGGGVGDDADGMGSPLQMASLRGGVWDGEEDQAASGGGGVPPERGGVVAAAAAAMDVLREVERMHATVWELEQNERVLTARLEDESEGFLKSEKARRDAEERARGVSAEMERASIQVQSLEEQAKKQLEVHARRESAIVELQERLDKAEPLVEEVKAALRMARDEIHRLRGQLEATGLSDTAMMKLLRGRDAALAAAAARASALEAAKLEFKGAAEAAETCQKEAEELAESAKGQLEGRGTFDRRTASMLKRAEDELRHLRIQAVEADSAAESLRTQLKASTSEAETLATELHESAEAVAARDELLEEAEEAAVASKEQFSRVQAEFEKEARRAGEAEALAASSGAKVSALREQLNASQECADNITKELEESQTVFQDVTCREQSLKEEVEVLRVQLGEIEGSLEERMADLKSLESVCATRERSLAEKEDVIDELRGEMEDLRQQNEEDSRRFAEAEEAISKDAAETAAREEEAEAQLEHAAMQLETLQERLDEAVAVAEKTEENAGEFCARIATLESELTSKANDTVKIGAALEAAEADRDRLTRECADLKESAEELQRRKADQLTRISAFELEMEERTVAAKSLQDARDDAVNEACSLREALCEAQARFSMGKEALEQAQSLVEAVRADAAVARDDFVTTRERLRRSQEEDLSNASERLRLVTDDLHAAREEIAALTAAKEKIAHELAGERDERRQMERSAAEAAEAEGERQERRIQEAAAAASRAEEDADAFRAKVIALEAEVAFKCKENTEMGGVLAGVEADHERLVRKCDGSEESGERLRKENDAQLAQISALEIQLLEETTRTEDLRESRDVAMQEASSVREALAEAKAGLSMAREALDQAQLSLEAERTGVAAAREDLATTRERLRRSQEEDLVNASQRLCLATDDLEAAKREIAALTAAEEEHARELAEERDERRQMEQNAVAAAMAAEEREKIVAQEAALKAEETVLAARAKVMEQEERSAEKVKEALSLAGQAAAAKAKRVKDELESAMIEVNGLRERLAVEHAANHSLGEEKEIFSRTVDALRQQEDRMEARLRELELGAQSQQDLHSRLTEQAEALRTQLTDSQEHVAAQSSELVELKAHAEAQLRSIEAIEGAHVAELAGQKRIIESQKDTIDAQNRELGAEDSRYQAALEAHRQALVDTDASISSARETVAVEMAKMAATREEALQSELDALRALTEGTTKELQEELALLRGQVEGAARSAVELKAEATAAAAAAAAARGSEAAAIESAERATEWSAERVAEAATAQRAAHAQRIKALEAAVAEAEERALAATAREQEALQESAERIEAAATAAAAADTAVAIKEDVVSGSVLGARVQSFGRQLDAISRLIEGSDLALDERAAVEEYDLADGQGLEVESGDGKLEQQDVERMLRVAKKLMAGVKALRDNLILAEKKADEARTELASGSADMRHLRSQNAMLEEMLEEVTNGLSSKNERPPKLLVGSSPSSSAAVADADANPAMKLDVARADALVVKDRYVHDLVDSFIEELKQHQHNLKAIPRNGELTADRQQQVGLDRAGMGPAANILHSENEAGTQAKGESLKRRRRSETRRNSERFASGEGKAVEVPPRLGYVQGEEGEPEFESDAEGVFPSSNLSGNALPSGICRALRSLVGILHDRNTFIEGLEKDLRRAQDRERRAVEERGALLEKAETERASVMVELQSLQASSFAAKEERLELETRFAAISRKAEENSRGAEENSRREKEACRMAEAEVVALREAAEASKREILTVTKDKEAYSARMEEAFADGRDGMLALREALERAVDETRGLLERADVAAAEAQGGELETLRAELRFLERRCRHVREHEQDNNSSNRAAQRYASLDHQSGVPDDRGRSRVVPYIGGLGIHSNGRRRYEFDIRSSWPRRPFSDDSGMRGRRNQARRSGAWRRHEIQGFDVDEGVERQGSALEVEAAAHEAASQMEALLYELEAFVLRQGIGRAMDIRRQSDPSGSEKQAAAEGRQIDPSGSEKLAAAEGITADRERESQAISVAKAKLEERVVSLEEAGLRARREADEQTAELEGLKTQRDNLVRRVAAAEAEAALARAIGQQTATTAAAAGANNASLPHARAGEIIITATSLPSPTGHLEAVAESTATPAAERNHLSSGLIVSRSSELASTRSELEDARDELSALRARLLEEQEMRQGLEIRVRLDKEEMESKAFREARAAAAAAKSAADKDKEAFAAEMTEKRRAVTEAERRSDEAKKLQRDLEERLDAAERLAGSREEKVRELDERVRSEVRRRRSLERALEEAEATNRSNLADASEVDSAALAAARAAADASTRTVVELRGQLARAMEGSVDLETRLKESDEENRRLKREVAEAVELGARAEAELGAALAGERLRRDGELTEIKSVVDEMMTLDASASGGGVAGRAGDLFHPPLGGDGINNIDTEARSINKHPANVGRRDFSSTFIGGEDMQQAPLQACYHHHSSHLGGSGFERGVNSLTTTAKNINSNGSSMMAGAAARLNEAWSLLESSEAARRRLQDEVKGWARRVASLEEALAGAEATAEERAREARLLAASLQDAREGLAAEEAARREAEGRAEALRGMLQAGGGGSGGGASPAAGGSGGDVARSLAGQVKALRSRVEELLERARDAEVREVLEKRGRKAAQRALSELTNGTRHGVNHSGADVDAVRATTTRGGKRRATQHPYDSNASRISGQTLTVEARTSVNETFDSTQFHLQGQAEEIAYRSSRDFTKLGGTIVHGEQRKDSDAVWLREAEAMLSRNDDDLGY